MYQIERLVYSAVPLKQKNIKYGSVVGSVLNATEWDPEPFLLLEVSCFVDRVDGRLSPTVVIREGCLKGCAMYCSGDDCNTLYCTSV